MGARSSPARWAMRAVVVAVLAVTQAAGPRDAVAAEAPRVLDASLRAPRAGFAATSLDLTVEVPAASRLVGARLAGARAVELRAMRREASVVTALPVASIDLPAGAPVRLHVGPGAFHLLALGLRAPLRAGQTLALTLDVQDLHGGRVRAVRAPVRVLPPRSTHADDAH